MSVPGYEFMHPRPVDQIWTKYKIPPPYRTEDTICDGTQEIHEDTGKDFTNQEAKEILFQNAKSKSCWNTRAANDIHVNYIHTGRSLHYQLWSTVEKRTVRFNEKPYRGDPVDGPDKGPPPAPWDVEVQYPSMGPNLIANVKTRVPRTTVVVLCRKCKGDGSLTCGRCKGAGAEDNQYIGSKCSGCDGRRNIECPICKWEGKVIKFVELLVKWRIRCYEFLFQDTSVAELPGYMLLRSSGNIILEEQGTQVAPLSDFPKEFLTKQSDIIMNNMNTGMSNGLITQQKQIVRAIPVTRCEYLWKGYQRYFVIYGNDNKVFASTYPGRCFGCGDCCQVM